MAPRKYREPVVDASLGLVDKDGKIVHAEDEGVVECRGPLRVMGKDGEVLEVCLVQENVVRVCHVPKTAGSSGRRPVRRTWVVSNGAKMADLNGWDREDDTARFGEPPQVNVHLQAGAGQRYRVAMGSVDVCLGGTSCGDQPSPFRLEWFQPGSSKSFACDSVLSAYAYEEGGKATHRMERRESEELYYGLGEVSGPLNRAGRRFRLTCRDAMGYSAETSDPLYKHFPFYITYNQTEGIAYGLLYDQLCGGVVDLGQEISAFRGSFRTYEADSGFVEYYLIVGPSIPEVVEKAGRLVGRPAVPPAWALGYVASTMTYADAPDAQRRLEAFPALCASHDMPCDGFYLSSGYTMDRDGNRNVFTWNRDRVPQPEAMLDAFHKHGMSVIANVKPWLLKAHPRYAEMKALGGFFHDPQVALENHVVGWFWKGGPGTFAPGSYLDFTNAKTFAWWKAQLLDNVLAQGVDAVWNDNNEFELDDDTSVCAAEGGQPISTVGRALQPLLMGLASYEALLEARPESRPLVVSRSGCLGLSRYAAQTWSGDNTTSFHTLKWNIPMSLGLGLCGWVGNGADIGGFAGAAVTPELFVRWIQLGIYMPRFSIHSSSWKANPEGAVARAAPSADDGYNLDCTNEPWMFPEHEDTVRGLLLVRRRLRPLLLSLHLEAMLTSYPVMRPLVFHFADDLDARSRLESFEFTLGPDLLVAAVVEAGATTREVYLPGHSASQREAWVDLRTGAWHQGGTSVTVNAPLTGTAFGAPLFLRSGGALVLGGHNPDSRLRELTLARDPSKEGSVSVTWFEDPTPGQCGRLESPEDLVVVSLTAYATAEAVVVKQFGIARGHGKAVQLERVALRLPPGDGRRIEIDVENTEFANLLTVVTP